MLPTIVTHNYFLLYCRPVVSAGQWSGPGNFGSFAWVVVLQRRSFAAVRRMMSGLGGTSRLVFF